MEREGANRIKVNIFMKIVVAHLETLLKEIRDELREIKSLYKGLVEKLIPVEEPLNDEKEAIESSDKVVSEREIMEALG